MLSISYPYKGNFENPMKSHDRAKEKISNVKKELKGTIFVNIWVVWTAALVYILRLVQKYKTSKTTFQRLGSTQVKRVFF